MSISGITETSGTATAGATGPMKGTKDEFLRLFMAQLQHQDPFKPESGADMVAQLAQLSSVEQAAKTNDQLAELTAQQASAASASLATLVGRDCNASAGAFRFEGGTPPPLEVTSPSAMKGASVVIKDADGKELRRIAIPDGAKANTVAWDGKDATGRTLQPGSYQISVDAGASTSTISAQWQGRVDAVELTPDGPRLRMGGVLLSPGSITTIGTTSPGVSP
jgi:flagellar basal-body rod modification protein FlgD